LGRWRLLPDARSHAPTSCRRARWPSCSASRARPSTSLHGVATFPRGASGAAGSSYASASPRPSHRSTIRRLGDLETALEFARALLHSATPRARGQPRERPRNEEIPRHSRGLLSARATGLESCVTSPNPSLRGWWPRRMPLWGSTYGPSPQGGRARTAERLLTSLPSPAFSLARARLIFGSCRRGPSRAESRIYALMLNFGQHVESRAVLQRHALPLRVPLM
jgi:hypothetical protein